MPQSASCRLCIPVLQPRSTYDKNLIRYLYETGLAVAEIARQVGVNKNTISGYVWRRGWRRRFVDEVEVEYDGPTSMERLDALAMRMNCTMPAWVAEWHNMIGTTVPPYYLLVSEKATLRWQLPYYVEGARPDSRASTK